MIRDLRINQMHSKVYLTILFLLIIPFVVCCILIILGIFVFSWEAADRPMIFLLKIANYLGIPAFLLHCFCAVAAAPYAAVDAPPKPLRKDPLTDDFPGPRYYVTGITPRKEKRKKREEKMLW